MVNFSCYFHYKTVKCIDLHILSFKNNILHIIVERRCNKEISFLKVWGYRLMLVYLLTHVLV